MDMNNEFLVICLFFFASLGQLTGSDQKRPQINMKNFYYGRAMRPAAIKPKPRDPEKSAIPQYFFTSPPNCNPHNYTFMINEPKLCLENPEVYLLLLIRTVYSQSDRRQAIRETWGNQKYFPNRKIILVFLFGAAADKKDQRGIEEESRKYGDVVQENFLDSYQNLTLKDVMAFKWAWIYCPHAQFVLVGSDEIVIDVFKLQAFLDYSTQKDTDVFNSRFALCHLYPCCTKVYHEHPKYGVQKSKYGGNAYPSYCSGTAYVIPTEVVKNLYAMSWDTPSFMPDDAWIGVLAEKLGLTFHDTFRSFAGIRNYPTVMKKFMDKNYIQTEVMIGVLDYDFPKNEAVMMKKLWKLILKHHEGVKLSPDFWRDLDRKSYPPESRDPQNDMPFAVSVGLLLDFVLLCALILICYWLKKKRLKFLCRRCYLLNCLRNCVKGKL